MRVLVACEYSGIVRDAFNELGHDAMSCDLLPTDKPGKHYLGNVIDLISIQDFDLMIAHPPCTYLTNSAEWAYKDNPGKNMREGVLFGKKRHEARRKAIHFVEVLANSSIKKIAIENPIGVLSTKFRKPDQFIQPYEYGHDASKKTCLWLKGLPQLKPTAFVPPRLAKLDADKGYKFRWANQTDSGQNKLTPSDDRWKIRSTTYQGWANAMAEQWGLSAV